MNRLIDKLCYKVFKYRERITGKKKFQQEAMALFTVRVVIIDNM